GQVLAGLQPIDGGHQRVRSGGDHRLAESQLSAVHLHDVWRGEAGVPEVDLCARLFDHLNCIARAAHGTYPTHSLHDRTELRPGRAVEPKAELGPAARIVDRASAANERLAWRAAKIDAGAPGQPLLRHRDAV